MRILLEGFQSPDPSDFSEGCGHVRLARVMMYTDLDKQKEK